MIKIPGNSQVILNIPWLNQFSLSEKVNRKAVHRTVKINYDAINMKNVKDIAEIIEPKKIVTGAKNAPITITEFGDYESQACASANDVVTQLLEDFQGEVKFIFRHFPLLKTHQKAHKASEAAIAAGQEEKFWEMHNKLFANRRNLGVISLKLHAREAGVTNKKFLEELINGTYGVYVQDDLKEGIKLGVTDIPAFFINGVRFEQEPTYKNLSVYIKGLLEEKKDKDKAVQKAAV